MARSIQTCQSYQEILDLVIRQYPDARADLTLEKLESVGMPVSTFLTMNKSDRNKLLHAKLGNSPGKTYLFRCFLDDSATKSVVGQSYGGGSAGGYYGGGYYDRTPPARIAKYSGIKNAGRNACYLNALIQSMFHMSYFRAAIYQMPTEDVDPKTDIPLALQRMFYSMEMKTEDPALALPVPTELMQSFGWDLEEQQMTHDIHELMRVLLDNLMAKMVAAKQPNIIRQLFAGVMMNYIETSDGSNYASKRKEAFMDLQLVIRDKKDIYESLSMLFAEEVLDGDNKYQIEHADGRKTYHPARRGCKLHISPPVVQFHCTRYDFNMKTFRNEKVTNKWEFYETIDLSQYVLPQRAPSVLPDGMMREDSEAFFRESSLHMLPDDTQGYVYRLYSVVAYTSGYGGGHYFSYVRTGNREWVKFNDDVVTVATTEEVFQGNFGGKTRSTYGYEIDSPTTAYMLTYIREDVADRILFPSEDIVKPVHLKRRWDEEQLELDRKRKQKAEDTKCVEVTVSTIADVEKHCQANVRGIYVRADIPETSRFKMPKTAAVGEMKIKIQELLGIPVENQILWKCISNTRGAPLLPDEDLEDGEKLREAFRGYLGNYYESEMWYGDVLVIDTSKVTVPVKTDSASKELGLFFKVFNPELINSGKPAVVYLGVKNVKSSSLPSQLSPLVATLAGYPEGTEFSFEKESAYGFTSLDATRNLDANFVEDGVVLIAVKKVATTEFPTAAKYLHFCEHSVTVKLSPVSNPEETIELPLLDDYLYKDVQKKVATLLSADPEYVRLIVHDVKKNVPDFANYRNKSNYNCTLKQMLSSYDGETTRLYFEVCTMKVAIMDVSEVVRFDLYGENLKPISLNHCCVLPKYATNKDVFTLIRKQLAPEVNEKLGPLRVISTYLNTIWSVHCDEREDPNRETRYLSSYTVYRVEELPKPIPDVPLDQQEVLDFCHFEYTGGRVDRHSDAFSMFVKKSETPDELVARLIKKLGLPETFKARLFVVPYDTYYYSPVVIQKTENVVEAVNKAAGRDLHVGIEHPNPTPKAVVRDTPLVIRN